MRIIIFFVYLLTTTLASASTSSAQQIHTSAKRFLETFAKEQAAEGYTVNHSIGKLDSRLSLATCKTSPAVSFSGDPWDTTHPSLLVSCEGARPWRMFLPVTLTIRGEGMVAARPLARGERITEAAITTRSIELNSTLRDPIRDAKQLIGMEMRRGVNSGTVFTASLLEAPEAVSRGDHVVISAESGGFSVRSRGKALGSGSIGEQVMVENLSSARTVRARIIAPGQVKIHM